MSLVAAVISSNSDIFFNLTHARVLACVDVVKCAQTSSVYDHVRREYVCAAAG